MGQPYIERSLEPVLKKAVDEFPAAVLTGPRQSGKTTLLKHLFARQYRYVSLEVSNGKKCHGLNCELRASCLKTIRLLNA